VYGWATVQYVSLEANIITMDQDYYEIDRTKSTPARLYFLRRDLTMLELVAAGISSTQQLARAQLNIEFRIKEVIKIILLRTGFESR
jgi:hypothetical protein